MNDLSPARLTQRAFSAAKRADHATASAFLNALLREWDGWTMLPANEARALSLTGNYADLPLHRANERLLIELTFAGRFRQAVALPFLRLSSSGALKEIPLMEALGALIEETPEQENPTSLQLKLLQRVIDSRLAMEQAFSRGEEVTDAEKWTFQQAEQHLKAGHPTHPNPRSRDEVSEMDTARYSPELGARFPLFWVKIHRSALRLGSATSTTADSLCRDVVATDPALPDALRPEKTGADFLPMPWHPWQAARLLAHPQVTDLLARGLLVPVGQAGAPFSATASMRCVHAFHAPSMLKFSLSMRLTNSRRVLSFKEVERGIQMTNLLESPVGNAIHAQEPSLNILREPGYVALMGPDGAVLDESFVVFRDNPFRDPLAAGPVMLASLCEEIPGSLSPLGRLVHKGAEDTGRALQDQAARWLDAFLEAAIAPLLRVRARHGLLFGSHQQNMMISLENGLPVQVWVRDCQGTGHLTTHHAMLESHVPDIGRFSENVADPELGDALLSYYVIVNNLMNVVSTLAIDGLQDETSSFAQIRDFLIKERAACDGAPRFYDMLLERPTLCSKGNYRTSLSGVNEAAGDAGGQLARFLEIPNPLFQPEARS